MPRKRYVSIRLSDAKTDPMPSKAVESWLREQVVPAARALQADPSRGIPIDQLRKRLEQQRHSRSPN